MFAQLLSRFVRLSHVAKRAPPSGALGHQPEGPAEHRLQPQQHRLQPQARDQAAYAPRTAFSRQPERDVTGTALVNKAGCGCLQASAKSSLCRVRQTSSCTALIYRQIKPDPSISDTCLCRLTATRNVSLCATEVSLDVYDQYRKMFPFPLRTILTNAWRHLTDTNKYNFQINITMSPVHNPLY